VEIVWVTAESGEISAGWSKVPLFDSGPKETLIHPKDTVLADEVTTPVFAGTPRFLLFSNEVPPDAALQAECQLAVKVSTHLAMEGHTSLLRENEIVDLSTVQPMAPIAQPMTLGAISFTIPGANDTGESEMAKLSFDKALMQYIRAVTNETIDIQTETDETIDMRALVGVHNVSMHMIGAAARTAL
jgi:hypothetical protein